MSRLRLPFYLRPDVVATSRNLLGKYLFTYFNQTLTGGIIVETEAYAGPEDRASHAHGGKRTPRTEVMYRRGGVAYVYLCYGIHSLFNIITNAEGIPHAVLVRAIEPTHGIGAMLKRRGWKTLRPGLASGPGAMSEALGIHFSHTGTSLLGREIWLEDRGVRVESGDILRTPRVGVHYAGGHARRAWRFRIRGNPWTSKAK